MDAALRAVEERGTGGVEKVIDRGRTGERDPMRRAPRKLPDALGNAGRGHGAVRFHHFHGRAHVRAVRAGSRSRATAARTSRTRLSFERVLGQRGQADFPPHTLRPSSPLSDARLPARRAWRGRWRQAWRAGCAGRAATVQPVEEGAHAVHAGEDEPVIVGELRDGAVERTVIGRAAGSGWRGSRWLRRRDRAAS